MSIGSMLWLFLAFHPADATPATPYPEVLRTIEADQEALSARWRRAADRQEQARVLADARSVVLRSIADSLFEAWTGTPWAFYGMSETPRQGEIACGYFVSTILRDAGFAVERVALAKQASEGIIRTFVPEPAVKRFHDRPVTDVLAHVRAGGDGLYLVGLDYHVAFLLHDGERLDMCHASYLDPVAVLCEPAETAKALPSRYTVVGRLLDDAMMTGWLEDRAFPTWRPPRR